MQNVINFITGDGYKVIKFPDGELHLELEPINRKLPVYINCRITSSDDLFLLMQLSDILKRQCVEVEILRIYYLMGQRCDRLFDINRPFTFGIVADVINSFNAHTVRLYEPHNFMRTAYEIKNVDLKYPTRDIVLWKLNHNQKFDIAVPDKGAADRYYRFKFAVQCEKVRDEATGELSGFKATQVMMPQNTDLLVIDDLCDGGGTFVGIAPELRKLGYKRIRLLVTHAIQKEGIEKVAKAYDLVEITDTYKDWSKEDFPPNVYSVSIKDLHNIME